MSVSGPMQAIQACIQIGDFPRALGLVRTALEQAPHDAVLGELHAVTLLGAGRRSEAIAQLRQLVSAGAAPVSVHVRLANLLAADGDPDGARAAAAAGLELEPGEFPLRLLHAECLAALGRADEALPEFLRAVTTAQSRGRWLSDDSTAPALRDRVRRAMDTIDRGRTALFSQVLQPHVDAHGRDTMERVAQALRIYLGLEARPGGHPLQQPTFLWVPGLAASAFFPGERFDWYDALHQAAPAIREEARRVLAERDQLVPFLGPALPNEADPYLGGDPATRAWDAYFFYRHGRPFDAHHAQCPVTSQALATVPLASIEDHAPEVLLSVLAPGTHIKPHYGVTNTRLVTHLPLIVPEGDCALVVGGEVHRWREGECVTFDDTFLHEAWNRSGDVRVVLILDTWHPDLRLEERLALKELVEEIGIFNRRAGIT